MYFLILVQALVHILHSDSKGRCGVISLSNSRYTAGQAGNQPQALNEVQVIMGARYLQNLLWGVLYLICSGDCSENEIFELNFT